MIISHSNYRAEIPSPVPEIRDTLHVFFGFSLKGQGKGPHSVVAPLVGCVSSLTLGRQCMECFVLLEKERPDSLRTI